LQPFAGALPPRFEGTERNPSNFSDFRDRVALNIVQLDDELVVFAELFQGCKYTRYGKFALDEVLRRGLRGGRLVRIGRYDRVFNQRQPLGPVAPVVVDELVIHHATEPRRDSLDLGKPIGLGVQFHEHVLNQVLCVFAMSRQSIGKPVHPVQVRTDEGRERRLFGLAAFWHRI